MMPSLSVSGFTAKTLIQRSKLWKIISQLNVCTSKLILVDTLKYTNQYIYQGGHKLTVMSASF